MVSDQHDHVILGLQMTDINFRIQTLKTGKFAEMVCLIRYSSANFQEFHDMWIGILSKYGASDCKTHTQKVIDCLQRVLICTQSGIVNVQVCFLGNASADGTDYFFCSGGVPIYMNVFIK